METSYSAHGKVILIGEHSVVYGYDALAMPIKSLQIKTTVQPAQSVSLMETNHYHGAFFDAPDEYNGLKYVLKTFQKLADNTLPVKLTYTGEIPMERGFGSSATVALGTSKALNKYYQLNLSKDQIMKITNHAEMINHGKASGLDAATVNSDYLVFFNSQKGINKIKSKLNATLLIMDTGNLGNTKIAVTKVHMLYEKSRTARDKMHELGSLADDVKKAWSEQNAIEIGKDFTKAQQLLAGFGVSTPKIDMLCKIAKENGAYGAKLSGGGLGGIVIALCKDNKIAQKIATAVQSLISDYWIEEI